jgi:hypothetical protein
LLLGGGAPPSTRIKLHALLHGSHLVPFFRPQLNESGDIHLVEIWHVECVEDQSVKSFGSKPNSAFVFAKLIWLPARSPKHDRHMNDIM